MPRQAWLSDATLTFSLVYKALGVVHCFLIDYFASRSSCFASRSLFSPHPAAFPLGFLRYLHVSLVCFVCLVSQLIYLRLVQLDAASHISQRSEPSKRSHRQPKFEASFLPAKPRRTVSELFRSFLSLISPGVSLSPSSASRAYIYYWLVTEVLKDESLLPARTI